MDPRQVFQESDIKNEFLDRFDELRSHARDDGGLEGLEGGLSVDDAAEVAESMAEGHYQPGSHSGVEAIIERFTRPVYLIQDATFAVPPDSFPESEVIAGKLGVGRQSVEGVIPGVGRIDLRNHRLDWVGTAWIVGPDLAVTNRHVAAEFAGARDGHFVFQENFDGSKVAATVDWRHEFQRGHESRFRVKEVVWIEPRNSVDVALLRISTESEDGEPAPTPIPLMTRDELRAAPPGEWVTVIGYPAFDSRNDAADQQRIFDGNFNVKRLAPGQITFLSDQPVLFHDATTLGGNSGSVVFDLSTGKAAALHFGGIQGQRNEAVQAWRLQEIIREHAG
jgi:Trypsin-like peptidase domain